MHSWQIVIRFQLDLVRILSKFSCIYLEIYLRISREFQLDSPEKILMRLSRDSQENILMKLFRELEILTSLFGLIWT